MTTQHALHETFGIHAMESHRSWPASPTAGGTGSCCFATTTAVALPSSRQDDVPGGRYDSFVKGRQLKVAGYEGKVVAVDCSTDAVVASADTPEELMRIVRHKHLENTMIVRVPRADEPLRVGLG